MKNKRRNISIKKTIIIVFILTMLVSINSIGYLIFTNWFSSAKHTTESIAEDLNESIYNQIYSFMHVPSQINEANHKIITNDILDITDERLRDKFFVGVLSSHDDEIYSFSYGTEDGEYYGARRNEKGVIEIMRNNVGTGGNSWYYSVNEDITAGNLVVQAGKFDPRTRAWYKAAAQTGGPTFSPIYKHFVMDDLTISFACPIYNKAGKLQGVLGTHMLLTDIGAYLKDAVSKYNGYAVILEKASNDLIANSMGINNFTVLQDGTLERHAIDKVEDSDFEEAYKKYTVHQDSNFLYEGIGQNLYINVKEIHMEGLDWVVISAIPERLLITPVVQSIHLAVLLTALALLLSLAIYMIIIGRLLKPMNRLLQVSEALSSGDLTKRVDIVRNDKITLDVRLLSKDDLAAEEFEEMRQHSVVGYRILNLFDDTLDLAEYVYSHHERWDGDGYPRGLKGEQIPLISRIISIVETYDRVLNKGELSMPERKRAAINIIKEGAGRQFEPQIAELFTRIMDEENK